MTVRENARPGPGMRWARWIWAIGFAEGTAVHAWFLLQGGVHAYRGEPLVIQLWFQALVLLDPLVVLLVLRRSTGAAVLGAAVMLGDLVANWWLQWDDVLRHPDAYVRLTGLPAITVFGLFVLLVARPLHRAFTAHASRDDARTPVETLVGQTLPRSTPEKGFGCGHVRTAPGRLVRSDGPSGPRCSTGPHVVIRQPRGVSCASDPGRPSP